MVILTVLVFVLGLASALGSGCTDVSGNWENELGSIMRLDVTENSRLTGEYWTAVEANKGASELITNITGIFSYRKKESLLAFSVLFNHGASLTSWVGQCIVCDGKEMLYTTYVLRKYVTDPKKKWTSLVINQNTFWRTEKDIPTDYFSKDFYMPIMPYSAVSDSNLIGGMHISSKWKSENEEMNIAEMIENVPGREIHISGKWKRNTSEEMQIYGIVDKFPRDNHVLIDVHGRKNANKILAVALVGKINERVRGWTGHISGETLGVCESLEASWLEHEFNPSCSEPRANVLFGMEKYTEVISDNENALKEPETFLEKIRRFFSSMF